jgi:hypothetical protein
MADSLLDPVLLAEAVEGFQDFSRRFEELAGEPVDPVDSIITYLRTVPAEDMRKKQELAKFFNSEAGSKYSAEERKAAYDELLGAEANRRLRG